MAVVRLGFELWDFGFVVLDVSSCRACVYLSVFAFGFCMFGGQGACGWAHCMQDGFDYRAAGKPAPSTVVRAKVSYHARLLEARFDVYPIAL